MDETSEKMGTAVNRENLMAMQGFIAKNIKLNKDGSVTETNSQNETLTTSFNLDGSVVQKFTGQKTITKTITFDGEGIVEVLS